MFYLVKANDLNEKGLEMAKDDFWDKYYGSLQGARILKFDGMQGEDDEWGTTAFPTFTVQFLDGSIGTIEISQDEEGNGGGFIFGLKVPANV